MDYLDFLITPLGYGLIFVFGALIGSFLNVVIYRYPMIINNLSQDQEPTINLFLPRSHCPQCQTTLLARDNIPLLSYLLLHGHCRFCHKTIALSYFLVELAAASLSVLVVLKFGLNLSAFYGLVLTYFLIALFVIDWQTMLLPDDLTLSCLWLGLIANITSLYTTLPEAVLGAVSGYLLLWLIFWAFKLMTKKNGLGYGDFKLLALLGAWFGVGALPLILFTSSILGIFGIVIASFYYKIPLKNTHFAFGPYLTIAGWAYLMYHS